MLTLSFLAGVLAVYYLTPRGGRQWILLAASLLFYLSADLILLLTVLLILLLFSFYLINNYKYPKSSFHYLHQNIYYKVSL